MFVVVCFLVAVLPDVRISPYKYRFFRLYGFPVRISQKVRISYGILPNFEIFTDFS